MSRESHEGSDGEQDITVPSISSHLCDPRSTFNHVQLLAHQLSLCLKELQNVSLKYEEAVAESRRRSNELHEQIASVREAQQMESRSDEDLGNKVGVLEAKVALAEETSVTQLNEMKQMVESLKGECEENKQQLTRLQQSSQIKEPRGSQGTVAVRNGSGQSLMESKVEELERGLSTTKVCRRSAHNVCCIHIHKRNLISTA